MPSELWKLLELSELSEVFSLSAQVLYIFCNISCELIWYIQHVRLLNSKMHKSEWVERQRQRQDKSIGGSDDIIWGGVTDFQIGSICFMFHTGSFFSICMYEAGTSPEALPLMTLTQPGPSSSMTWTVSPAIQGNFSHTLHSQGWDLIRLQKAAGKPPLIGPYNTGAPRLVIPDA